MNFRCTSTRFKYTAGFTLVELLASISIVSILTASAVPGFQSMMERNRMTASVNLFLSHLYQARSEAVKRVQNVTLCPSRDGENCIADYTQWAEGYILFVDQNKNRAREAGEEIISFYQGEDGKIKIYTSSNYRRVVSYNPTGRAWGFNTTIRFCATLDDQHNRSLIIASSGRPRSSNKMPDGRKILCN